MEVKLLVLEGKHKDREIPLPETIFLIGRDKQCHLRPHCQLVSKLHCAIAAWAGKVRVRDLKSRNGTFLNGQPVQGEVLVGDGDRLQVGRAHIRAIGETEVDERGRGKNESDDQEVLQ